MNPFMDRHYNKMWTSYIRLYILGIIIFRGGLVFDIKGKIASVLLISTIPVFTEIGIVALISREVFSGMSYYLCFYLGSIVSAGSTAILIFSVLGLKEKGYGVEKGIDRVLIPGVIVNTVVSVFCYVIFKNLALDEAGHADDSIFWKIGQIIIQLTGGIVLGKIMGWLGRYMKTVHIRFKIIFILFLILGTLVFCYIKLIIPTQPFAQEAYIIAVVSFAITIRQHWDHQ